MLTMRMCCPPNTGGGNAGEEEGYQPKDPPREQRTHHRCQRQVHAELLGLDTRSTPCTVQDKLQHTTCGEALRVTVLHPWSLVEVHIEVNKMLGLRPSNLLSRHLAPFLPFLRCEKSDGTVWAQLTGVPAKHALCPKSRQVQTHWDAMPRALIHEAECEPSLWVTGGARKQQLRRVATIPAVAKRTRQLLRAHANVPSQSG